jgi:hypothetical protein
MSLVSTDEPIGPDTNRYLEYLGLDIGALEAVRDPEVRSQILTAAAMFAFAVVFAFLAGASNSSIATLVAVICTAWCGVYGVKWTDEAVCILRSEHTCDECRRETERWEVTE